MTKALWFWYFLGVLAAAENPVWLDVDRHVRAAVPERFPDTRVTWQKFAERRDLRLATLTIPMASPHDELRERSYSLYGKQGKSWRLLLRYLPSPEADVQRPWFAVRTAVSEPGPAGASLFVLALDEDRQTGVRATLHLRVWLLRDNSATPAGAFDYPHHSDDSQLLSVRPDGAALEINWSSLSPLQRFTWRRVISLSLRDGKLIRVPPISPNPRDFVEELAITRYDELAVFKRHPILDYVATQPCTGGLEWAVVFTEAVFQVENLGDGEWRLLGITPSLPPKCQKSLKRPP